MDPDTIIPAQLTFDFGDSDRTPAASGETDPDSDMELLPDSDEEAGEEFLSSPDPDDSGESEADAFSGETPWEDASGDPGTPPGTPEETVPASVSENVSSPDAKPREEKEETGEMEENEKDGGNPETVMPVSSRLPFDGRNVKRAALAFLATLAPDGIAPDVPTKYRKYVVDAAAYWTAPDRKGCSRVSRTAVVETRMDHAVCTDCANREELASQLSAAKLERAALEESIRKNEPKLRETDNLFGDFERWNYSRSRNPAYKTCLHHIKELEYALFHGSRFDKLRKACVASEFYLAVPENTALPSEIADAWGLVYILPDLSFRLVKAAEHFDCPESNLTRLALNIGRASARHVLFANGIDYPGEGAARVIKQPRKRRG